MNEQIIVFTNKGEIDPLAMTTLGVNVKDSDSPIGHFGTGLKYAIATLLRQGLTITVLVGEDRLEFSTQPQVIRGKEFKLITMRRNEGEPQPLGFTTQLGREWQPWMAYRELWSNCQDEGGEDRLQSEWPEATPGWTHIILHGRQSLIQGLWETKADWLFSKPVRCSTMLMDVAFDTSQGFFYKGIRVAKLDLRTVFTYNWKKSASLTEDRTMDSWAVESRIKYFYLQLCNDPWMMEQILVAEKGTFEQKINWASSMYKPSELFVATVARLMHTSLGTLNPTAIEACRGLLDEEDMVSVPLDPVQQKMLEKAKKFLAGIGHEVTEDIIIVESLGSRENHGLAKRKKIYLPLVTFEQGTKYVASTLLEEHLHCKHGFEDMTRKFQTYLLDRIISLGETLQQEPI